MVGDLQTVALVGMHGSVDFLCFPYFDSPTVFAALLDRARGGRFALTPLLDGGKTRQLYLSNSNILLTRFLAAEAVGEVIDFMVPESPNSCIVRIVQGRRGAVARRVGMGDEQERQHDVPERMHFLQKG